MTSSLVLLTVLSQATAFADVSTCVPGVFIRPAFPTDAVGIPPDATVPVLGESECGGSGPFVVRLHRMVDGILAEEVVSGEGHVSIYGTGLALLDPPDDLLEETDYAVVLSHDWGDEIHPFTTGSTLAAGMAAGAPSLEVFGVDALAGDTGGYDLTVDALTVPLDDPDGLSYLQLFEQSAPDTPIESYLPRSEPELSFYADTTSADLDEICFTLVQTDALGAVSAASEPACAVPIEIASGCCSTSATPASLGSALLLGLLGLIRRRDRSAAPSR